MADPKSDSTAQPNTQSVAPGKTISLSPSPANDTKAKSAQTTHLKRPKSSKEPKPKANKAQPPQNTPQAPTAPSQSPVQPASNTQPPQANPPHAQRPQPGGWDDFGYGGDPFGGYGGGSPMGGFGGNTGFGASQGPGGQPQKRLTPEERIKMIEKIYDEVLCRKPDTRDINYYKYSTLNEDQVRKQILTSAEHKDMIKKGREHAKIKERADQMESRVRMLEGQVQDQVNEFRELSNLLHEKNKYIQEMREKDNSLKPSPTQPMREPSVATPQAPTPSEAAQPSDLPQESVTAQSPEPSQQPEPSVPPQSEQLVQPAAEQPFSSQPTQPDQPPTPAQPIFTDSSGPPMPPDLPTDSSSNKSTSGGRVKELAADFLSKFF